MQKSRILIIVSLSALFILLSWNRMANGQVQKESRAQILVRLSELRVMLEDARYPSHIVRYDLACCQYQLDSLQEAAGLLLTALPKLEPPLRARAYNLMGVIEANKQNFPAAAEYFKQAIKVNSSNDTYKRNFEIAYKQIPRIPPPLPPPPPLPDAKGQVPQYGTPKPTEHLGKSWTYEAMPPEKADALLLQMRRQEEQYIQQLKKTVRKSKKYSAEPQW